MKKTLIIVFLNLLLFISVGCVSETRNNDIKLSEEHTSLKTKITGKEIDTNINSEEHDKLDQSDSKTINKQSESNLSSNKSNNEKSDLNNYANDDIEYARIWLQLGQNQHIDSLTVNYIAAGEPLNSDDHTSLSYPEDVTQLSGNRLVDGSITYSSNYDGTINVYNVPLRWDGQYPASEDLYKDIINNTERVSIKRGNDHDVIQLIKLINQR